MQPQRGTMAQHLADIIHILHIGTKSGTLTAERSTGGTSETGVIVFMRGQVVEARVGQQSGSAALTYLNTWQTCYFSFSAHDVNPAAASLHTPSVSPGYNTGGPSTTHPSSTGPFMPPARSFDAGSRSTGSRSIYPSRSHAGDEVLQDVEHVPLSRVHRRLLLLLNGQRNLDELARLMARTPPEIQEMLNALAQAGLIQ